VSSCGCSSRRRSTSFSSAVSPRRFTASQSRRATSTKNAVQVEVDALPIRVISIDDLIAVKEHVRRPKDLEVSTELRAIRDALKPKA
jgi:hypothetical protein